MNEIETALRNAAERLPQTAPADSLVERAAADGLLDVAYATVDSPLGPLVVASTPRGLARVAYTLSETRDDVLEDIARRLSPRMLEAPGRLDDTRRELDEYFEGERTEFDLPIDWALTRGFTTRVLRATAEVGFGHTTTYAEVATRAGSPARGARRGQLAGLEPDADRGALSPRAADGRGTRRLHRRPRAQGVPAAPRGCARLAGRAAFRVRLASPG